MVNGVGIKKVSRDDLLDDLLQQLLLEVGKLNILRVLGRDNDSVDTKGDGGATVLLVFNRHLSLGIRTEPRKESRAASCSHGSVELVRQDNGEGHALLSLVRSITEHDTLVTSTMVFETSVVETLCDIG